MEKLCLFYLRLVEIVACFFWRLLLRLLGKEWTAEQWLKFRQFIRYCAVGVVNTVVNFAVYALVLFLLDLTGWDGTFLTIPDCNAHLATICGFVTMILNSFYWNGHYTFTGPGNRSTAVLGRVFAVYTLTMTMQLGLNVLFITLMGLPKLLVNPINQVITIPVSFYLNKHWAFKAR